MSDHDHLRAKSHSGGALAIATSIVIIAVVTGSLYARVVFSAPPPPKTPLTVTTQAYEPGESYTRQQTYLGLVTAGERAQLGFEVGGTIGEMFVKQGSKVQKGDVLATLDSQSLTAQRDATQAELDQVKADHELSQLKLARQKTLIETGAVSKDNYDETRIREQALAAAVAATQARLVRISIDLEKAQLRAPYDGVIAQRHTYPGVVVSPGMPVVRLLQTGPLEAHVGVAAKRAKGLLLGAEYNLVLNKQTVSGTLTSLRADIDPHTRSAIARFTLPEDLDALDGEPISLELEETIPLSGGWVPITALIEGRRGLWTLLRIDQNGRQAVTVRESVEVLDVQGNQAYVRGTLPAGSLVVADGTHRITPGNPVLIAQEN